jgi:hypothetical protein
MPGRESFCNEVWVGGLFSCRLEEEFAVVRIWSIEQAVDALGDLAAVVAAVEVMAFGNIDEVLQCPYLVSQPTVPKLRIDVHQIIKPEHVVPACSASAQCTVHVSLTQPPHFGHSRFALNGVHAPTDRYVFNSFFIK